MLKRTALSLLLLLLTYSAAASTPSIVVFGDSLSSGFGLSTGQGWVELLKQRLHSQDYNYRVINASIAGDTTASALSRLPQALSHQPSILIVELGGNDGLRGLSLSSMEKNLRQIIQKSRKQNIKVLLVGMQIPPNYGPLFSREFTKTFQRLSQELDVPLVPFLLRGLEERRNLFQQDQIHPKAEAQSIMLDNIWQELKKLL